MKALKKRAKTLSEDNERFGERENAACVIRITETDQTWSTQIYQKWLERHETIMR